MELKDKKILITGGAGFIGSNIAEILSSRNDVTVIDSLRTGKSSNLPNNVELIKKSILDIDEIGSQSFEIIFHLAAMASTEESFRNPSECIEINTAGTAKLLEYCRKEDVERFIVTSTAAVYGNIPDLPKKENMELEVLTPYSVSKHSSERLLHIFTEAYGIKGYSLRLFNVFGPRQDPSNPYSGVISIFIDKALRGDTIYINGDGSNTRDFIYVKDVVSAFEAAAVAREKSGLAVNISTGVETRIDQLAELIISKLDSKSEIEYREARVGDIHRSYADNSLAKELLNWEPKYTFESGLIDYLEWLQVQ